MEDFKGKGLEFINFGSMKVTTLECWKGLVYLKESQRNWYKMSSFEELRGNMNFSKVNLRELTYSEPSTQTVQNRTTTSNTLAWYCTNAECVYRRFT